MELKFYFFYVFIIVILNYFISFLYKKYDFIHFFVLNILIFFSTFVLIHIEKKIADSFSLIFLINVIILFLYAGLKKSISFKLLYDLSKLNKIDKKIYFIKNYYNNSFFSRIRNLTSNSYLEINKNKYYYTKKNLFLINLIKYLRKIYKIGFNG